MVSIMPCTAKKAEAVRPNSYTHGKDTGYHNILRMIDNFGLDFVVAQLYMVRKIHLRTTLA